MSTFLVLHTAVTSHEIRNEILASEQKNEKHVPLTYCQDNRKRR